MNHYPSEFKADGVALYESRPDATIGSVAAYFGVNPETLLSWVRAPLPGPGAPGRGARRAADAAGGGERRTAQEGS